MVDVVAPEDPAADTFLQTIDYLRDPSHVRDHRLSQWKSFLKKAGFVIEGIDTWRLELHFDSWTQRMATPADKAAMLEHLFAEAPAGIRKALQILDDRQIENLQKLLESEELEEAADNLSILCRDCLHPVTDPSLRISKDGHHRHVFNNPHGITFEIGCFSSAMRM